MNRFIRFFIRSLSGEIYSLYDSNMDFYPLLPQDPRFQSINGQNPLSFATSPLLKITRLISRGISITASQCVILVPVHRFINMAAKARFYRGSPTFFNWRSGDPSSDRKHRRTKVFAVGYENRKLSCSRARIEGKGRNFTVPRFLCVCVYGLRALSEWCLRAGSRKTRVSLNISNELRVFWKIFLDGLDICIKMEGIIEDVLRERDVASLLIELL